MKKGIAAGADAYVPKPDIHELLARIKQLTSHHAPPVALQIYARAELRPVSGLAMHAHGRGWISPNSDQGNYSPV
jgi:DNA-binding response OmpR family regulator